MHSRLRSTPPHPARPPPQVRERACAMRQRGGRLGNRDCICSRGSRAPSATSHTSISVRKWDTQKFIAIFFCPSSDCMRMVLRLAAQCEAGLQSEIKRGTRFAQSDPGGAQAGQNVFQTTTEDPPSDRLRRCTNTREANMFVASPKAYYQAARTTQTPRFATGGREAWKHAGSTLAPSPVRSSSYSRAWANIVSQGRDNLI